MANTTFDANILINYVGKLSFTGYCIHRAIPSTDGTAGAGTIQNLISDQGTAYFGRTSFFKDVGFVFIHKVCQGGNNRIGGTLT